MNELETQAARLKRTLADVEQVVRAHVEQVERIRSRPRVRPGATPEEQREAAAAVRGELQQLEADHRSRLAELRAGAEEAVAAVQEGAALEAQRVLFRPAPETETGALLRETRALRIWARHREGLAREDAFAGLISRADELLRAAVRAGDEDTVEVLLTEVPPLAGRFGRNVDQDAADQLRRSLTRLRPELAAALQKVEALSAGAQRVRSAFHAAESALRGRDPSISLPRWEGGFQEIELPHFDQAAANRAFAGSF